MRPETKYALSGDVNIAYQIVGNGPTDLVFVPGWVSNIDETWTEPSFARFLNRLASFTRLILFDKRGTGLSDRVSDAQLPTLEQRMDDVRAVLDAAGSVRAALLGVSEGGPMCALFAATYPDRTTGLLTFGSYARSESAPDYPWGRARELTEKFIEEIRANWGGPVGLAARVPSRADDPEYRTWWANYRMRSASPGAAMSLVRMNAQIDVRHVLPAIRVPTLIMCRSGDRAIDAGNSRYMAGRILSAKLVEFPGEDHLPWTEDQDRVLGEIEEFVTGVRHEPEHDRVLATVIFLDLAGSTEHAATLGDRKWRDLLERYLAIVRAELAHWRGKEMDTAGDGLYATFDGPARAVRCAQSIRKSALGLGLELRAGLHTGEVESINGKAGGIAVHIGARVAALAAPGEVLVSNTVKDLVVGSGIGFEDRGFRALKGVPGEWHIYLAAVS